MFDGGITWYQICWYFVIYSFFGWVVEVVFHAVTQGKVINRGFLNGPICPIYGMGMSGILLLTDSVHPISDQNPGIALLFFGGTVLATLVELIAGWLLDKLFHAKWWDYSGLPFNFRGYICLKFSLLWGIGIVITVDVLHPLIDQHSVAMIPPIVGWPILGICYAVFFADLITTVILLHNMNRNLTELEQINEKLRAVSDGLTNMIAGTSIAVSQKIGEGQVQAALGRAEWKEAAEEKRSGFRQQAEQHRVELQKRADELAARMLKHSVFGPKRILQAFPNMRSRKHTELLELLKKRMHEIRR